MVENGFEILEYMGKVEFSPSEKEERAEKFKQPIYPYLPSDELIEVVNLAIALKRPLLLQGEPGCGKTQLAQAVAYELNLPYLVWNIKSTSRAQDGLYTYDHLARLRDSQLLSQVTDPEEIARAKNPATYLKFGQLGQAFINKERTVLLIDEIDKADIDFPNDLLLELDQKRFTIPETGEEIDTKQPPIIFITSNQERDLPDAFLRRCLFHYVKFPDQGCLIDIIKAHNGIEKNDQDPVIKEAVTRFSELRESLAQEKVHGGKNTSTSELLDWFKVLSRDPEDQTLAKLKNKEEKLPYLGVLLKRWDDHLRYLKQFPEVKSDGD